MKRIDVLWIALFLLVSSTLSAHLSPGTKLIKEISARTVMVTTEESMGNGIVVEDGKVLTVAHLRGTRFIVQTRPRELLRQNPTYDMTLLSVPGLEGKTELGEHPELGQEVIVIGYTPGAQKPTVGSGQVFRLEDAYYFVDMPLFPGNSGSGVYDKDGKLIGIATGIAKLCDFCAPLAMVRSVNIIKVFLSQGE